MAKFFNKAKPKQPGKLRDFRVAEILQSHKDI
jgi:hypothetical protein